MKWKNIFESTKAYLSFWASSTYVSNLFLLIIVQGWNHLVLLSQYSIVLIRNPPLLITLLSSNPVLLKSLSRAGIKEWVYVSVCACV